MGSTPNNLYLCSDLPVLCRSSNHAMDIATQRGGEGYGPSGRAGVLGVGLSWARVKRLGNRITGK
jgi:hypothetical protein